MVGLKTLDTGKKILESLAELKTTPQGKNYTSLVGLTNRQLSAKSKIQNPKSKI
jgi:hypothetical protein